MELLVSMECMAVEQRVEARVKALAPVAVVELNQEVALEVIAMPEPLDKVAMGIVVLVDMQVPVVVAGMAVVVRIRMVAVMMIAVVAAVVVILVVFPRLKLEREINHSFLQV